ncbi:uncharacterized protein LOC142333539 isoform X1 [Lycorma delicatula]|uniref:uncharacterized protein LOC142333539 isoform X1 n=1 Tax=Lycorma delicatula TaxID=130591 RepID=UPI003F51AB34
MEDRRLKMHEISKTAIDISIEWIQKLDISLNVETLSQVNDNVKTEEYIDFFSFQIIIHLMMNIYKKSRQKRLNYLVITVQGRSLPGCLPASSVMSQAGCLEKVYLPINLISYIGWMLAQLKVM